MSKVTDFKLSEKRSIGEIFNSMDEEQKLCYRVSVMAAAKGAVDQYLERRRKTPGVITISTKEYSKLVAKATAFDVECVFTNADMRKGE